MRGKNKEIKVNETQVKKVWKQTNKSEAKENKGSLYEDTARPRLAAH
jgi:hypothetical protein